MSEWFDEKSPFDLKTIPFDFITRLASGLEDPITLAAEFGYSTGQYYRLMEFEPFTQAIDARRNEMFQQGLTFKSRMKIYAEMLADDVFATAIASTGTSQKLSALQYFSDAAEIMPKKNAAPADSGPKFVVNINIPQVDAKPETVEIDLDEVYEVTEDMLNERDSDPKLLTSEEPDEIPDE